MRGLAIPEPQLLSQANLLSEWGIHPKPFPASHTLSKWAPPTALSLVLLGAFQGAGNICQMPCHKSSCLAHQRPKMPGGNPFAIRGSVQPLGARPGWPPFRCLPSSHPSSLGRWEGTPALFSQWKERGLRCPFVLGVCVRTPFSLFLNFLPYELVTICKVFFFTTNPYIIH